MTAVFEVLQPGLFKETGPPMFGRQDLGISPGGAMDRLAYETGRIFLGCHPDIVTLEMILPPVIRFTEDCCAVFTGARFAGTVLKASDGSTATPIAHAETFEAAAGATLECGEKTLGFRGYLSMLPVDGVSDAGGIAGRKRGDFDSVFSWPDPQGAIRVVKGPEHGYLEKPDGFVATRWKTTQEMSDMGMRLAAEAAPLSITLTNMISAPVSDGTIQLTPRGPIILLRHRQTVGGYPRIYNVISADVDLLAQYGPEQVLRFREVPLDTAFQVAALRQRELDALASRFAESAL